MKMREEKTLKVYTVCVILGKKSIKKAALKLLSNIV